MATVKHSFWKNERRIFTRLDHPVHRPEGVQESRFTRKHKCANALSASFRGARQREPKIHTRDISGPPRCSPRIYVTYDDLWLWIPGSSLRDAPERRAERSREMTGGEIAARHVLLRVSAARRVSPPYPNRCASQNAAPAARPPTSAVCSADLILLTPVKWPLIAPKIRSAMPVTITDMRSADEMSWSNM